MKKAVAVIAGLATVGGVATVGATQAKASSMNRGCGSFLHYNEPTRYSAGFYYKIRVSAPRAVNCRRAMGAVKTFWSGRVVSHGGPDEIHTWYTTHKYPGWRFFQGAGGGGADTAAGYRVNYSVSGPLYYE